MNLTFGNTEPNDCFGGLFIGHNKIHFKKFYPILQAVKLKVAISTLTILGKPAAEEVRTID